MVDTPAKVMQALGAESPVKLSVSQAITAVISIGVVVFTAAGLYFKFDAMQEDMKKRQIEDSEWKRSMQSDMTNLKQQVWLLQLASTGTAQPKSSDVTAGFPNVVRGGNP